MNNNGDPKVPIPFPPNSIPIVGQPYTLKSWFPTAIVICNCEAHEPILLVGEGVSVCPACKVGCVIAAVTHQHGQPPQIGIGRVHTRPPLEVPS